jgi:hypothetical protein
MDMQFLCCMGIIDNDEMPLGETRDGSRKIDTPRDKSTGILGSTRPLKLGSLRYLAQRWDSPQALTLGMPYPSCIAASPV